VEVINVTAGKRQFSCFSETQIWFRRPVWLFSTLIFFQHLPPPLKNYRGWITFRIFFFKLNQTHRATCFWPRLLRKSRPWQNQNEQNLSPDLCLTVDFSTLYVIAHWAVFICYFGMEWGLKKFANRRSGRHTDPPSNNTLNRPTNSSPHVLKK
jgi:hypothetical protein